jgi:hypothetical protein
MENENKGDEKEKRYISYDTAESLLLDKFFQLHPKNTHPEWLSRLLPPRIDFDEKTGKLVLSVGAYKKEPLGPNHYWEEKDGRKHLMYKDPTTGKISVVIHYTPKEYLTIFKAVLDAETAEVTVLVDTDLSSIVGEELDVF